MSEQATSIVARRTLHEGVKFALERVRVRLDGGREHEMDVIRHPGAVVVVGVLDDGRVTLIRVLRPAVDDTLIEAPAGTLEPGEEPAVCARRELIEEAGYEAAEITPIATFHTTPGMTDERMHAFLARGLRPVGQKLEANEQIDVVLVEAPEAVAMASDGRITDAKSMLALILAAQQGLLPGVAPAAD